MSKKYAMSANCGETNIRGHALIAPDGTLSREAELQAIRDGLGELQKEKRMADYGLEAVINGYLSGTMTPIANALSIGVQSLLRPTVYAIGAGTDALKLTKGNRSLQDAFAMLHAATEGFVADMHYFRQGFLRGYPIDVPGSLREMASASNRTVSEMKDTIAEAYAKRDVIDRGIPEGDQRFQAAFKSETARFRRLMDKEEGQQLVNDYVNEGYDYIRKTIPAGKGGDIVRIPTKLTVGIDEYGKARFRRQKLAQMASVRAREQAKGDAKKYKELYEGYRAVLGVTNEAEQRIVNRVAKQLQRELDEGSIDAKDAGKRKQDLTEAAKGWEQRQKLYGKVFGQNENDWTPYNLVREFTLDNTFQSRLYGIPAQIQQIKNTPTDSIAGDIGRLTLGTMVPFIKTPWNILKEGVTYVPGLPWITRPKYAVDGIPTKMSADELLPRQILGSAMFGTMMMMFDAGRATGAPQSPEEAQAWKDQGVVPFAIKIGDIWIPYQRIEPIATAFGLAADLQRAIREYEKNPRQDKETGELFTDLLMGLKYHIMSKSFMEGFASVLEFATDPARVDEQVATQLLRPLTPAILNEAARLMDPVERQATTPLEKTMQRVPGLRETLPPDYGLFGDARTTNQIQAITGFGIISDSDRSPLQLELDRLDFTKGRVGKSIQNVGLDNDQIAEYRKRVAQKVTPVLEKFISSPSYENLTDSRRKVLLEKRVNVIKRDVAEKYGYDLYKSDPVMAEKFRIEMLIKEGRL